MDQLSMPPPADADQAPLPKIDAHFGSMKVQGSVTVRDDATAKLVAGLMLGELFLGSVRLKQEKGATEEGRSVRHFGVPEFGLPAFRCISGLSEISVTVDDGNGAAASYPIKDTASVAFAPLAARNGVGNGNVRLADLWLANSRLLALRFEAKTTASGSVDAYQCLPGARPVMVGSNCRIAGMTPIIEVTLVNPFAPVLLVFKGEDECIDAIDLLPFPSLVRGGMHHAELLIAAIGIDDLTGAAIYSRDLLASWIERLSAPTRCVATVEVDPAVHTGLEPILNEDLLSWMGMLQVGARVCGSADRDAAPAFIRELIGRQRGPDGAAGHTLHVPADCVPTIAALVRAVPGDAAPGTVTGGKAVVDRNQHGQVWSVWQPALGPSLEKLQPAKARRFAPALTIRGGCEGEEGGKDLVLPWPLALALRDFPTRISANSPFEIAPEVEPPLLRTAEPADKPQVEALILFDRGTSTPVPLLESLARQEGVSVSRVLLCAPDGQLDGGATDALADLYVGRSTIVAVPATAGRLEQIAIARGQLNADRLFLVEAATVLTDPRTLFTLMQLMEVPEVKSAGCLLRGADDKMAAVSAGYSFSRIDLRGTPTAAFDSIDPQVLDGPATYPVVASSLSALLTGREMIDMMDAGASTAVHPEHDDLLFGVQAIEHGGVNLCTTVVSAYVPPRARSGPLTTISIPYRLTPEKLASITESSILVQRVA
jgi:hypothetical protein